MALNAMQRIFLMQLCLFLAAVVPLVTLFVLGTQDPDILAREMLADPDCLQCVSVRRRCDSLLDDLALPAPPLGVAAAAASRVGSDKLPLDCASIAAAKDTKKKASPLLRTLCEKESGAAVPVADAANLLLRSVCENSPLFKQCSAFMNLHREAILAYFSNELLASGGAPRGSAGKSRKVRSFAKGVGKAEELPRFCWPVCEGRLKPLDQIVFLLLMGARRPAILHLMAAVKEVWGALLVLGVTACLLGTGLHLSASLVSRGLKLRLLLGQMPPSLAQHVVGAGGSRSPLPQEGASTAPAAGKGKGPVGKQGGRYR